MNEELRFVLLSWLVLITGLVVLTLFVTWIVESALAGWNAFIESRREKEIIKRLRERQ